MPLRSTSACASCLPAIWPAADDTQGRGTALREFLKCCRARLSPADFGFTKIRQRRVSGLRQEDVAKLAGVSPRWYEVFERGKSSRRFSASFVMRVADALCLEPPERAALSRLAIPEVALAVEYFERLALFSPGSRGADRRPKRV